MRFIIDDPVRELFPELEIAVFKARLDAPRLDLEETLAGLQETALRQVRAMLAGEVTAHPHIRAWRDAYKSFKVKASKYKPTHEALARRLLADKGWPRIMPAVDLYLTNQIAHLLPHGGYDRTRLRGELRLTRALGGEIFTPLYSEETITSPEDIPTEAVQEGEVVYRDSGDEGRVLTRRWNFRDAHDTAIREYSRELVLMIERPSAEIPSGALREAGQDLVRRFEACFEGEFDLLFIDACSDGLVI
jgi:DNA/RNA-binding domain of Phe-tRNA-synthetase-like protein